MSVDRCVMCGDIIPEGFQFCPKCGFNDEPKNNKPAKMKNYEAIQRMNKKEMAAVFFMFLKPFIKKLSKKETTDLLQSIEQTLDKEVTPSGITTSEKQP